MMRRLTSIYTLNYPILIGLMVVFVVFIILDKWCVYAKTGDEFGDVVSKNLRSVMILLRLALAAIAVVVALTLLGLYDAQKILTYVLLVFFLYMGAFLVISFAVSLIKKELTTRPLLNIPAPFSIGASKDLGLLTYFEENTGMTMRSLWSMQVIRRLIPYTVTAIAIVFWLSTGIVQVEPYQKGVVYRFGQLEENVLEPGLHMTLPWPMDKIEVYDTETLNRMTVGYIPSEDSNNTWTGTHGSNEYKLLLGSADELVSINLRIEYKISDIRKYVMNNAKPEKLLEAYAYELVMSNTINTDLENLLSVDRNAFSASFRDELSNRIGVHDIGIAVVDVVLESIHPPIDVAEIYQKLVSAEIEAQRYILDAEAYAKVVVAAAETRRDTAVNVATADSYKKIAEAKAEVAEFMAGVEADKAYPSAYRYYKYLNAITKAYGNAKLVIVGEDIDTSKIYFGSLYKSDSSK
jgi:membrane protease subunit HflK